MKNGISVLYVLNARSVTVLLFRVCLSNYLRGRRGLDHTIRVDSAVHSICTQKSSQESKCEWYPAF